MVRGVGVEIWFSVLGSKLAGFVLGSLEAQLFDRSLIWEKSTGWPSTCWGFNKSLFYLEYLLVHLEPSNCKAVLFVSFFFFVISLIISHICLLFSGFPHKTK